MLGEVDLANEDRQQFNFYADKVVLHPDFNPLNDLRDNLALVKLNVPAPMGTFRPVCLPPTGKAEELFFPFSINLIKYES